MYKDNSIGVPFPDTDYKIVAIGTNEEVPYGTDGEICISGPTVMMGYINNINENLKVLREHQDKKYGFILETSGIWMLMDLYF